MRIFTDFPGGNVVVDRKTGSELWITPELRGSEPHDYAFHLYFGISDAGDDPITVHVSMSDLIPSWGPVISWDGGVTFDWLGKEHMLDGQTFLLPVIGEGKVLRISTVHPYVQTDLERFIMTIGEEESLFIGELVVTPQGRSVEELRLGNLFDDAEMEIMFTARHHCRESMANYVLEGVMLGILRDDECKYLRKNVRTVVIPFIDKDGVENGDQGKLREPHDHYEDYSNFPIYPEIQGLQRKISHRGISRGIKFFFDLHGPGMYGEHHEKTYFLDVFGQENQDRLKFFSRMLEKQTEDSIFRYYADDNLSWGSVPWNADENAPTSSNWAGNLLGMYLAATMEVPYWVSHGQKMTPEKARSFGVDFAKTLDQFVRLITDQRNEK